MAGPGGIGAVGRADELAQLLAFLDAPDDLPGAVVLEGEAGIGKTTIWRAAVHAARARSFRVLTATAAAAEAESSFVALGDLLAPVLDDVVSALPGPRRRALAVALLLEDAEGRHPDRLAVARAFHDALRLLAGEAPVLVAVDDVQWLDPASAAALEFTARRLEEERVGLLAAVRANGGPHGPLALARVVPEGRVRRIRLGPLSLGALHFLLHDRLGTVFSRPVLRRLHELSGGNPLFALELGRAVRDGSLALEPGERLPPDLDVLVRGRVEGLPAKARTALGAAAAASRPTIGLLRDALPELDVAAALGAAVEAHVVDVAREVIRFEHPLLASAAYALMPPRERRDLHQRLAGVVADVEERARHLALAAEGPDAETAAAVEEAAGAAFRRGATSTAAELAGQARRLTPPGAAEHELRRALAEAEYRFEAGDTDGAASLLAELVAAAPPGPARARLLSRQSRYSHFGEDVGRGVDLLRQALAEAGDDARLRVEIEEGLAWGLLLMREDLHAAAAHARSAVGFAERLGDDAALAESLAAQGLTEFVLGADASPALERALSLEDATLALRVLRHPSFAYGYRLSCRDEVDRAREVFHELHRRATEHGDESALAPIHNHLALVECMAGRFDAAIAHADEGYAIALQSGQRPSQASILSKKALVLARRGEVEQAGEVAERALTLAGGAGLDASDPRPALARGGETALWTLGFLRLSQGDAAGGDGYLDPLARSLLAAGVREPGELRCLPDAIEAKVALGRLAEAEALLAELDACAQAVSRAAPIAAAGRCRGLLLAARGDLDGAVAALSGAADATAQLPLPFEHARTLLALGQAQRRVGAKRKARDSLEAAVALFERLGSGWWAERARAELARVGGRAPAGEALTVTERRVAELVAEGRSNKEVAAALFVTVKAVEANLSRVYAKLGVRSRTELTRRLAGKA